jgi:putative two-component system response regulator
VIAESVVVSVVLIAVAVALVAAYLGWRDARRRQSLADAVEESEAKYRALVERLPAAAAYLAEFGEIGNWRYISPQIEQILGFTVTEWESRPGLWLDQIHPDDRERVVAAEERSRRTGEPLSIEYRMVARDGRLAWMSDEAVVIRDRGEPVLQGLLQDVTKLKEAEEVIRRQHDLLEGIVAARTRELEDSRLEILQRLALAAEYRDDDTHQHTERVGRTAALLAARIGLPEATVAAIRTAAPLHDVGKIGIPDSILLKPGRLTAEEFELIKQHAAIGARILAGSGFDVLQTAEEIALTHHERWDGHGYPAGLAGEQIPVSGRLTALADVFDGLTHDRPYKTAWGAERAAREIERLSGTHFDPAIVEAFRSLDHVALAEGSTGGEVVGTPAVGESPRRSERDALQDRG